MQQTACWFRRVAIAASLASLVWAVPAWTEDEPGETATEEAADAGSDVGPPPGVEVLRVRGRGLSEIETDVPASVTSFDAATIEALGAADVSDLSRVTPNVTIVAPGTQAAFFVRGIGLNDFSANATGSVTIFQDDVSINAAAIQTPQLFDVEGVDILRGPQGTGPYRNASGGAIRVRSKRPTGNASGFLRVTRGRYSADGGKGARKAIIQDYEGAVEMPLIDDIFSSRLAFKYTDKDPFKTNSCGFAPPIPERRTKTDGRAIGVSGATLQPYIAVCGENGRYVEGEFSTLSENLPGYVGDEYNWAARGNFRITPPDSDWDIILNGHGSRLDQQSELGQSIGTSIFRLATNSDDLGGFGGLSGQGVVRYHEPDIKEEYYGPNIDTPTQFLEFGTTGLCQQRSDPPRVCANQNAQRQLARNLTRKRPLDRRPFRGDYDRVGIETRDFWGAFVSAEGKLGDYDLFLLGSFDTYERFRDRDIDFSPDDIIVTLNDDEAWQTYEEVRISGELRATPFTWEVGSYFLYEQLEGSALSIIGQGATEISRDFEQKTTSVAGWGKFNWDFLPDLSLEGGVRINYEKKEFDYTTVNSIVASNVLSTTPTDRWLVPTGEIILTWHIDERAQAYARYTHGFKAGHFNSVATARLDQLGADPETNDAWEAGVQGNFWDRRLSVLGAFFYYRYEDYQVFLFSDEPGQPPTLAVINAEEAELFGAELEIRMEPLEGLVPRWIEGLQITANASWLQGQYIDFTNEQTFVRGGGADTVTFDFSGNQLANSPKYKVSASAEWTVELGRLGSLTPRYDFSWTDDQFFDPREGRGSLRPLSRLPSLPPFAVAQRGFYLHNIRLTYRTPSGNVEIAGWIRNLTDEVYKAFAFDLSRFADEMNAIPGDPRTMGFDVVFTF